MNNGHKLPRRLTDDENELMNIIGEVALRFARLPQVNPNNIPEVVMHVSALQNIIMARPVFDLLVDEAPRKPELVVPA